MKLIVLSAALMLLLFTGGCQKSQSLKTSDNVAHGPPSDAPNTATIWVHGMACPQCANNVDLQLLKVAGVESVKVEMNTGRVFARLSPTSPPTREQLAEAIKNTGFTLVRIDMPSPDAAPAGFEPNTRS